MSFIEDPIEPIVSVRWHKKKPPDGTGGPPEHWPPGPCGMYTSYGPDPGFNTYSPRDGGLWELWPFHDGAGNVFAYWCFVPHLVEIVGPDGHPLWDFTVADYLCSAITSTTVTAEEDVFGNPVTVAVWRNQDPCSFDSSTAPDFVGNPANIENIQPNEKYYPIFRACPPDATWATAPCTLLVQFHCADETDGGLPLQPPGYPVQNDGCQIAIDADTGKGCVVQPGSDVWDYYHPVGGSGSSPGGGITNPLEGLYWLSHPSGT
jgi:hypothetical protein